MKKQLLEELKLCKNYLKIMNIYEKKLSKLMPKEKWKKDAIMLYSIEKVIAEISLETHNHSRNMMRIINDIVKELNISSEMTRQLKLVARFHDIGKVFVDNNILNSPNKLTEEEWVEIKKHPTHSSNLINSTDFFPISNAVLHHHERFDGAGYPAGLKGEDIPLFSRIISVIDCYEVLINGRVYKKAVSHEEAIDEILRNSGTQFDPEVVKVFIKTMNNKRVLEGSNSRTL